MYSSYKSLRRGIKYVLLTGLLLFILGVNPIFAAQQISSVHAAFIPNDEDFSLQRYLNKVRAPQAWDIVRERILQKDIIIALLDTGVDIDHPELKEAIWMNTDEIPGDGIDNDNNTYIDDIHGWDFIESSSDPRPKLSEDYAFEAAQHGTVVAGVVAAKMNNIVGIAGASMGAKIMPLRVLDSAGSGNTLLLAQAIDYAVENGADIINLSLVGEVLDQNLVESIDTAYRSGVAVVAASGNQESGGINLNTNPHYPVCDTGELNKVLGIAAVDEFNRQTSFSNYGSRCIDLSAPGTNFYSTQWVIEDNEEFSEAYGGGWIGTSVAAPLVSSALALVKKVSPNLSVDEMYRAVLSSTRSLQSTNTDFQNLGAGLLDMEAALSMSLDLSRFSPLRIVLASGKGSEPLVTVQDQKGIVISEFFAYTPTFTGGITVATGDVDGDGELEIVTAPMDPGGPHVRIFDIQGRIESQFMAYRPEFRGGVSVAVGDINGDGIDDIITAPRKNGGPHIKIFTATGEILNQFMAYAPTFEGGVSMNVGDMDLDNIAEIITAPASSGGPHVRIFNREGLLKGQFMAFDPEYRGGLTFGIGDIDDSRGNELVVAQIVDTNVEIRIFNTIAQELNRFLVFADPTVQEKAINLFVDDFTGDVRDDIIVYPQDETSEIYLFDSRGRKVNSINLNNLLGAYSIRLIR